AVGAHVRRVGDALVGLPAAGAVVVAVAVDLVPDLPVLDADRGRVADGQEVVAVVGRHLAAGAHPRPEADRLPVVARVVDADRLGVRRIAVRVGDPGGGLLRHAGPGS